MRLPRSRRKDRRASKVERRESHGRRTIAEQTSSFHIDRRPRSLDALLMPEPKIRLQVNVAIAAEAEGQWAGEGFQVAVCTGVVEQTF